MPNHTGKTPFFDARKLPNPENSYVAWVDVMGVRATMSRSLPITANFVFKLHAAVLDAPQTDIHLYPVMDGVYVVAERQGPLRDFLKAVFSRVADSFVSTSDNHHRFIIKAAIAFGPVIHGDALPRETNYLLDENRAYRDSVLLGMPMIQAIEGEKRAPPYGVFIHESARAFAPIGDLPFHHLWWHWTIPDWRDLGKELNDELIHYFEWASSHALAIEYDKGRIEAHREMARQYLVDL